MTHEQGVTLVVVAYHSVTTQCDSDSILSLCRPERSNFNTPSQCRTTGRSYACRIVVFQEVLS